MTLLIMIQFPKYPDVYVASASSCAKMNHHPPVSMIVSMWVSNRIIGTLYIEPLSPPPSSHSPQRTKWYIIILLSYDSKTSQVRQSPFTEPLIPLRLKPAPDFPPILPQSMNPYLQIQRLVYAVPRKCCYSSLVSLVGVVVAICMRFPHCD